LLKIKRGDAAGGRGGETTRGLPMHRQATKKKPQRKEVAVRPTAL